MPDSSTATVGRGEGAGADAPALCGRRAGPQPAARARRLARARRRAAGLLTLLLGVHSIVTLVV